jgi:integrase/recombinase XerD
MTTDTISPLRQRMVEDMNARKLCPGTQRGHISSCKRFAAFLKRSPDTATLEDIRRFQLHLADTGARGVLQQFLSQPPAQLFTF